jgi:hypothetical protein
MRTHLLLGVPVVLEHSMVVTGALVLAIVLMHHQMARQDKGRAVVLAETRAMVLHVAAVSSEQATTPAVVVPLQQLVWRGALVLRVPLVLLVGRVHMLWGIMFLVDKAGMELPEAMAAVVAVVVVVLGVNRMELTKLVALVAVAVLEALEEAVVQEERAVAVLSRFFFGTMVPMVNLLIAHLTRVLVVTVVPVVTVALAELEELVELVELVMAVQ